MATPFEVHAQQHAARSHQIVHGTEAPVSALPMGASVPVEAPIAEVPPPPMYAPGDKFYLSPEQQQTIAEAYDIEPPPPSPDPLSQATVPRSPEFKTGMDVTQASDAELWTPIVKGAPGFSGSGVSGETFHEAVVEMSKRQTEAALERQRTGEIDVSVESPGGAFVEAGVVGPAQYFPENTPKATVEQWRAKEAYEAASLPRVKVGDQTYYKPPEFETVAEWDEALQETFDPAKFVPPPSETELPSIETSPMDASVYEWAISSGYGENAATDLATTGKVSQKNMDELPKSEISVSVTEPETFIDFVPESTPTPTPTPTPVPTPSPTPTSTPTPAPTPTSETVPTGDVPPNLAKGVVSDGTLMMGTPDGDVVLPEGWTSYAWYVSTPAGVFMEIGEVSKAIRGESFTPYKSTRTVSSIQLEGLSVVNREPSNILGAISDPKNIVTISGIQDFADEGDPWEVAVSGVKAKSSGIPPTVIKETTIPGISGYAFS